MADKPKLLLVDDEPDLREILAEELDFLGWDVTQAESGHQALEFAKKQKFDAIISDIRMPNGDGVELLKEIRKLHAHTPPHVFITGYADLTHEEAYHFGSNGVFHKPFAIEQIHEKLMETLAPPKTRWGTSPEKGEVTQKLEFKVTEMNVFPKKAECILGRSGFFIEGSSQVPSQGDVRVSFALEAQQGPFQKLEGVGTVRWIRPEGEDGPAGLGLEIESLVSPTPEEWAQFQEKNPDLVPIIPSPVV